MIKVNLKTKIATPEPIPDFLKGLKSETLMDLSWTDVSLGVSDCAWWPEVLVDNHDPNTEYVDGYTYTINLVPKTVTVTAIVKSLPQEEIDAKIAAVKTAKLADLAAYRYAKEIAGIAINGTIIKTDEISQAKLTGTWATVQMNPSIEIEWKGANGWAKIKKAEIDTIAMAVSEHVEACYKNEHKHEDAIVALTTIAEIESYDITTGWPE